MGQVAQAHYFSAQPAVPHQRREITATIAGARARLVTDSGVFSPGHIDAGTAALLQASPVPPQRGTLLDIGCGWGPIALTLAAQAPGATVWAVDVNERALELTAANAARLGFDNVRVATPDQVPAELRFAGIWSNPPIRIGKPALHALLAQWLPRLTPSGEAWLVVAKNLGADSLQAWLNDGSGLGLTASRVATSKGFRVIRVTWR